MTGLGYLQDAPDPRDRPFSAVVNVPALAAPAKFSNRDLVASVLRQGSIGSCVIHSCAQAIRMVEQRIAGDKPAPELLSRLWGYYNSRVQHGDESRDTGTYIRLTIKALNQLGRPPEHVWPYDVSKYTEKPPLDSYRYAHDFRKANYARIWESGETRKAETMTALAARKPVVFGTAVGQSFLSVKSIDPIPPPVDEPIIGGHAMCAIGYDAEGVEIVNSWGTGWGEAGYGRISWEYFLWHRTLDIWVIDL